MLAYGFPCGNLIFVADGRVDVEATRVGFFSENVVDQHTRHFSGVLGVNRFFVFRRFLCEIDRMLNRHQRSVDFVFVRDVVNVLQLMHAA